LLLSLVISITILLSGGSVLFFLSCAGEGGGGGQGVGKLYIGGYVFGEDKGYIYVVCAGTKDLIATIEIPVDGAKPDWLTLSPDGKKLYCSSSAHNRVFVIDTETDTYEKEIVTYSTPEGIAFTPDGTKAVVGCFEEINIIDVATGVGTCYSYFSGAQHGGVTVHPTNGKWYAAVEKSAASMLGAIGYGDVDEISNVSYLDNLTTQGLADIDVSSDGSKFYTSENSQNNVVLGTIDGNGTPSYAGVGFNPSDSQVYYDTIALTPDDSKLYIARTSVSRIDYLETASPSTAWTIDYGGSGNETMDVALSDDGETVFVLVKYPIGLDSINGGRVVFINASDGSVAGSIDVGTFDPISIAYKNP
jgi:YVTN family beta-propeller protein